MTLEEKKQLHAELLQKQQRIARARVDVWNQARAALDSHDVMQFQLGELKAELVHLAVEIAKEEGNDR